MAINWDKLLDVGVRVGVPLVTAADGASQAKKAGKAGEEAAALEANALKEAAARSDAQYAQTRADFEPWRKAGVNALKRYEDLTIPGAVDPEELREHITSLPGYDFERGENEQAFENLYSKRSGGPGGMMNGRVMKEAFRWNSDRLARPHYESYKNDLRTLSGYGPSATNSIANHGTNNALRTAAYNADAANAQGAGIEAGVAGSIGAANSWTNALKSAADAHTIKPFEDALITRLKTIPR